MSFDPNRGPAAGWTDPTGPTEWGQGGPPPPPHPGYQGQPVYVAQSTNGLAVASLVLGILWLYWIGSILALVFGYVAKSQIDRSQGRQSGRGMAVAGIVLGWVGVGILSLVVVIGIGAAIFRSGTGLR